MWPLDIREAYFSDTLSYLGAVNQCFMSIITGEVGIRIKWSSWWFMVNASCHNVWNLILMMTYLFFPLRSALYCKTLGGAICMGIYEVLSWLWYCINMTMGKISQHLQLPFPLLSIIVKISLFLCRQDHKGKIIFKLDWVSVSSAVVWIYWEAKTKVVSVSGSGE